MATLAATAELAGGLLTAAGLADPLGPVTLAATMAVASTVGHRGKGPFAAKGGFELPLTNLAAAAVLGGDRPRAGQRGPAARPAAPAPAGTPDPGRRRRGRGHHDRAQRRHGQTGHHRSGPRRRRGHTADRRPPIQLTLRYICELAPLGLLGWFVPDMWGQLWARGVVCWTGWYPDVPPVEPDDAPELDNALAANSTTASPASTVATRSVSHHRRTGGVATG
jgi:hypothetical protein